MNLLWNRALLVFLSINFVLFLHSAGAQSCHFTGPKNAAATERILRTSRSCSAAGAYLEKCRWGSSADVNFSAIVISKCEKNFKAKLSVDQKKTYTDKSSLCADEYANQSGTIALSEEWTCLAEVAFDFATNLTEASKPLPRAGFDCEKAQSPLEMTVCAHPELGRQDLLLTRSYSSFSRALKPADRKKLIESQRAWSKSIPAECRLTAVPASPAVVACLKEKYKLRVSTLDSCGNGLDVGCVSSSEYADER